MHAIFLFASLVMSAACTSSGEKYQLLTTLLSRPLGAEAYTHTHTHIIHHPEIETLDSNVLVCSGCGKTMAYLVGLRPEPSVGLQ